MCITKDIPKDVETKFDTSRHSKDENRQLSKRKNEKVLDMMKDKLGAKISAEFVALRAKMYTCRKQNKKLEDKH